MDKPEIRRELEGDRCPCCNQILVGYRLERIPTPEEIQEAMCRREDDVDLQRQAQRLWRH